MNATLNVLYTNRDTYAQCVCITFSFELIRFAHGPISQKRVIQLVTILL